jgi:hypothetical protein
VEESTLQLTLIIITAITAGIIAWQAWETRRASTAMRRSLKLQEVAAQQWLLIEGWRIEARHPATGIPDGFEIAAEVTNPTGAPLTIVSVSASVDGFPPIELRIENVLGPGEPCKFAVPVSLSSDQKDWYKEYKLSLGIRGSVTYKDALGESKAQPFAKACNCDPGTSGRFFDWQPAKPASGR